MLNDSDIFVTKVGLIMESPTERNRYKQLSSFQEKIDFLRGHFVMNEMAIRLLERKYLLSDEKKEELMKEIDLLISKEDAHS